MKTTAEKEMARLMGPRKKRKPDAPLFTPEEIARMPRRYSPHHTYYNRSPLGDDVRKLIAPGVTGPLTVDERRKRKRIRERVLRLIRREGISRAEACRRIEGKDAAI